MGLRTALLLSSLLLVAAGCGESHTAGDAAIDASPGLHSCASPTECELLPESCCGRCGAATPDDMIGVHRDDVAANRDLACMGGTIGCPECAMPQDPFLVATCELRACVARDLHALPLTECAADSDCVLAPHTCCACGVLGIDEVVAYNPARGELSALICDPGAPCPPCVPVFGELAAFCESGRCVVRQPM